MDDQKEGTPSHETRSVLKVLTSVILAVAFVAGGILIYRQQQIITDLSFRVSVLEKRTDKVESSAEGIKTRLNSVIRTTNRNFRAVQKTDDDLTDVVGLLIDAIQKMSSSSSYQRNGL